MEEDNVAVESESGDEEGTEQDGLLLAFYGDDFTGSTDALEGLADNGVRAVLFLHPPTREEIGHFDDIDAVGVAGASRSMTPAEMNGEMTPAFQALAELDPPIVHYKVCSTFDSAPDVGSIGRAIDLGQTVFESPCVPVIQGTEVPHGRYVAFSNLFAVQDGETYRIDRHPTMRDHPVTPMHESDLRRHLAEQTDRAITRLTLSDFTSDETARSRFDERTGDGEIVVFDGTDIGHFETTGELVWEYAQTEHHPLFTVGSSGLEHHSLVHAWSEAGQIDRDERLYRKRDRKSPVVVISGSASSTTASQIDWAEEHGFRAVRLDSAALIDVESRSEARESAINGAIDAIENGQSVVLCSAHGPDDPAIEETRQKFESLDVDSSLETVLGRQQGRLLLEIIERTGTERACIAGGDTSSHALSQLPVRALEAIAPVGPGGPLCRVHSERSEFDGLEMALKGGQVGTEAEAHDYFGAVREGGVSGSNGE